MQNDIRERDLHWVRRTTKKLETKKVLSKIDCDINVFSASVMNGCGGENDT